MRKPLLVLPLLLLAACQSTSTSTTPTTTVQNFQQLYRAAVTADDLIIKMGTNAVSTGTISPEQARTVLAATDAVKSALDIAEAAYAAADMAKASGTLASATGTIGMLSVCLTQKPLTVATFGSCTQTLQLPKPVIP